MTYLTILSDKTIKERIRLNKDLIILPLNDCDIQPCSIDLHLGPDLKTIQGKEYNLKHGRLILEPGEFILGSTYEHVEIPLDLAAQVDGKSSIGRLGIDVHKTAGWIDAGFKGNITLEINNNSNEPFTLTNKMPICQIIFFTLTTPVEHPYGQEILGSHYQNSKGTILSKRGVD